MRSREGAGRPAPQSGWSRAGLMAWTHFWKLIAVNLLFVLFSLPVITAPAALCALDRVCMVIYKNGNIFLWDAFFKEFKRCFVRSLAPALGFGLLLFAGYFFLSLANGNAHLLLFSILLWALGCLLVMAAVVLGEYFFAQIALLEISNRDALKNALLLSLARPGSAVLVLVIVLALSFAAAALMPFGVLLLLLLWFSLMQYPVCYLIFDVTEDLILIPYANQQAEKAAQSTSAE